MHAVRQRSAGCPSLLCPDKAVACALWGITGEARRYCAGEVVVHEEIKDDEEAW